MYHPTCWAGAITIKADMQLKQICNCVQLHTKKLNAFLYFLYLSPEESRSGNRCAPSSFAVMVA